MKKARPERVNPQLVESVIDHANSLTALYSRYFQAHYAATGRLAPGCKPRDLKAYVRANYPGSFDEKGKKVKE